MRKYDLRLHANNVENALLDYIEKLESTLTRQASGIAGLITDNANLHNALMVEKEFSTELDRRLSAIENNVNNVFDTIQLNTESTNERFEEIENTITEELG